MDKIYLTIRNSGSYEFVGEIEDTGRCYKFTRADGSGLGECKYRRMYGEAPRYKEYEYDKIEKIR